VISFFLDLNYYHYKRKRTITLLEIKKVLKITIIVLK